MHNTLGNRRVRTKVRFVVFVALIKCFKATFHQLSHLHSAGHSVRRLVRFSNFVWTTMTEPIILPLVHVRGVITQSTRSRPPLEMCMAYIHTCMHLYLQCNLDYRTWFIQNLDYSDLLETYKHISTHVQRVGSIIFWGCGDS